MYLLGREEQLRKEYQQFKVDGERSIQALVDHLEESKMWKEAILDLQNQRHPATANRYTQADAERDNRELEQRIQQYVDRYYQRKRE